jgi:hypothetical protein
MARLFVHVEGETEETFVNQILRPHLVNAGYHNVSAKLLGNARARTHRGGIRNWPSVRQDILRHLRSDQEILSTVMVDYYALPKDGDHAWPGRDAAPNLSSQEKGRLVEEAISADIAERMGVAPEASRFIPYVMMYEFEALLFSDCQAFADGIGLPELGPQLSVIRSAFLSPEDINDSPLTAPSKRVTALIPKYQKPLFGNVAAHSIGLESIRAECANFSDWLTRLEQRVFL